MKETQSDHEQQVRRGILKETRLFCKVCANRSKSSLSVEQLPTRLAGDGKETPGGKMVHALRSIGSAAMNYTQVAMGGLDLYWYVTTSVISVLVCSLVSAGRSGVGA